MQTIGFLDNEEEYEKITVHYNESHRKYHNLDHIKDCLNKCQLNQSTKSDYNLHLAIWYHDVIYKSLKKNNELRSAEMAERFLIRQSANRTQIDHVKNIIMATLHAGTPNSESEAYMMDIDISILGSEETSYREYCDKIRKEYRFVPWFLYRKKRIEILDMFLKKDKLYFTDYFETRFENQARQNIQNEIERLKSK